jgi:Outer membrane protein beta-barrel domain
MKLSLLLSIILLITFSAGSQPSWYIFAGPQATSSHYTIDGARQNNNLKIGFQAGLGCKVPFDNQLSFSPAVFYSLKGYKVTFNRYSFPPDSNAIDNNTTIHTFEVAGLLQFDFSMQPDHFFIKAGPSLDFQLFGHEKYHLESGGMVNRKMKYGFGDYGHYSASLLAQFGYETANGLIIFAQYTRGVTSINNADYGPKILHRIYGISIGKYLHWKKTVVDTKNKE